MATAKAGPRRSTRDVTLKLTEGEADLLLSMFSNVGGSTTRSPRKYADRMRNALTGALGYTYESTDAHALLKDKGKTGIFYNDYGTDPEPMTATLSEIFGVGTGDPVLDEVVIIGPVF